MTEKRTKIEGELTQAEKDGLKVHAQKWIDIAFRTQEIDRDKIVPIIKDLYVAADLKAPEVFVVSSPLAMAFKYGELSALSDAKTTGKSIKKSRTLKEVLKNTQNDVERKIVTDCYVSAGDEGLSNTSNWYQVYQGGNMWAGLESYISAFRDVLRLDLPEYEKYKYWENAAIEGGFRAMHEDFCIVSDFPVHIKVDDEMRAHCEDGPSHLWRDGWALYHWHGQEIPTEWITDPSSLTPEIALTWENVDQRSAACEILGWHNIINALNPTVIDTDDDPQIGRLVEIDLPDHGKQKFIHAMCGTGREVAVMADASATSVLEAQAASYGLNKDDFIIPEIRT